VPHASVVLAGARSLDPPEEARLAACAVTLLTVDELRDPATLVAAVPRDTTGVYLHLDLDVLDEQVNVYSAPDGLSAAELDANVAAVLGAAPVRAITLSAYDPSADRDIRVVPAALRVLETIGRHVASGS
jgi:arginase